MKMPFVTVRGKEQSAGPMGKRTVQSAVCALKLQKSEWPNGHRVRHVRWNKLFKFDNTTLKLIEHNKL